MYRNFVNLGSLELNTQNGFQAREGQHVSVGCFQGQAIAILTSGGDSQGMNAAIKSAVRMGIYCGATVFFVFEGLQGLVNGGLNIKEAYWSDVAGMINLGGTVIGSARCADFRTRIGRLRAAKNLIDRDILNLVVIGGDGSLTGANIFKQEWISYLEELITRKIIDPIKRKHCERLNIVGLVGSIDNDFCGTDMTIGVDSALTRILESTDALMTTAHSHQRCFVVEVMGRHCGYLALVTAICSEAQFVFIPEKPPGDNWREDLCYKLSIAQNLKSRANLVIVSEGAIDSKNNPITAAEIRKLITDNLGMDTRITVLGHVQRGGSPTVYDRLLGLRQGAEAILTLIDGYVNTELPACVICINRNQITRKPLMECVKDTQELCKMMDAGQFEELDKLRGPAFTKNYMIYETLNTIVPLAGENKIFNAIRTHLSNKSLDNNNPNPRLAIICAGTASCGMNSAIRGVVRSAIVNNFYAIAIRYGFEGLLKDSVTPISWTDVQSISSKGGCLLGTRRSIPENLGYDVVAAKFKQFKIAAIVVIGGLEAFISGVQLYQNKSKYPEFQIPICIVPCTINNNIPGIQTSIGNDTALNVIVNNMDSLKLGCFGTRYRIYIMEVMGFDCGYLNSMSALCGGADLSYIDEEELDIATLNQDVNILKAKMLDDVEYGIVLRSNITNHPYDCEYIYKLFKQEGRQIFDCRKNSLGHVTLGGRASAFDRNIGTKFGVEAVLWIKDFISQPNEDNVIMIGLAEDGGHNIIPIQTQFDNINYQKRRPYRQWWLKLRPLMRIIQTHESMYDTNSIMKNIQINN